MRENELKSPIAKIEQPEYTAGIVFESLISNFRSDSGGGVKITLHIFEQDMEAFQRLSVLLNKNVQVAIVPLPDEGRQENG